MKVNDWLEAASAELEQAEIGTSRLDCLVLLEDATGKDRSWLLAHPDLELTNEQLSILNKQLKRRTKHEPLAYIRGKTEFFGREFTVSKDTLEPRPETETMITLLKQLMNSHFLPPLEDSLLTDDLNVNWSMVDVGTGSGAIAITTKLELPQFEVIATDISEKCLKIARQNAKKHKVNIKFYQGDLLQPLSALSPQPSALLCNLPYVPDSHTVNEAAMHEPKMAIFGGPDGLDIYRRLFKQIANFSQLPEYIFTESLPFQHKKLAGIAQKAGFKLLKIDDFIQVFVSSSAVQLPK